MGNFNKPEGQTTSDNFNMSEIDNDSLKPQSLWGDISRQDENYLSKKGLKTPAELLKSYRELEKAFSYAAHGLNLTCLIFNFVAKTLFRTFWRRTAVW